MHYTYTTQGVCARSIEFDVEDGLVKNIQFNGGCNGNAKGIASLAEGLPVAQVIERLKGITCGAKASSCPDQLATALSEI
ncbi:MAG: TIGR03905 family TSCPD domain-containing protein [Eubacterium sp.]|nr:TIGR03905 family TSCPD domain-containing protein [Eubacterium sp.]